MGRLHVIAKVSIRVYANDHLPPHFHIVGIDEEALVEIATLHVLRGSVADRDAMIWAEHNIEAIRAEWNRINPRFPIA